MRVFYLISNTFYPYGYISHHSLFNWECWFRDPCECEWFIPGTVNPDD